VEVSCCESGVYGDDESESTRGSERGGGRARQERDNDDDEVRAGVRP